MSNVANWVTKFVKSVCGLWLLPCQKFDPDTRLKLALPVPECLASRALFYTWCEAAFRRSKAALTTICLERRATFQSSRPFTLANLLRISCACQAVMSELGTRFLAEESSSALQEMMCCTNGMPRRRQYCDGIGSTRSSELSRGR